METKVITLRIPQPIYEKLCKLADEREELPSETARKILRESLSATQENPEEKVIIAERIPDEEVIVAEVIPDDD